MTRYTLYGIYTTLAEINQLSLLEFVLAHVVILEGKVYISNYLLLELVFSYQSILSNSLLHVHQVDAIGKTSKI